MRFFYENIRNKSSVKNVLILQPIMGLSWTHWGVIWGYYRTEKQILQKFRPIIKMILNYSLIIDPNALEFTFHQTPSGWPWHSSDPGVRMTLSCPVWPQSFRPNVKFKKRFWAEPKCFDGNVFNSALARRFLKNNLEP